MPGSVVHNADIADRVKKYRTQPESNLRKKLATHSQRARDAWDKFVFSRALVDALKSILGVSPHDYETDSGDSTTSSGSSHRLPQVIPCMTFGEMSRVISKCRKHDLRKIIYTFVKQHYVEKEDLVKMVELVTRRQTSHVVVTNAITKNGGGQKQSLRPKRDGDGGGAGADHDRRNLHWWSHATSQRMGRNKAGRNTTTTFLPSDKFWTSFQRIASDSDVAGSSLLPEDLMSRQRHWDSPFAQQYLDRLVRVSELQEQFVRYCDAVSYTHLTLPTKRIV